MTRWFRRIRRSTEAAATVFCFHHAGGAASSFREWTSLVPDELELVPVQLPGRENRSGEQPYRRMDALVEGVLDAFADDLGDRLQRPFAFFGHSMGARVSFALAHGLAAAGLPGPTALFLSATPGPTVRDWKHAHQLPDEELLQHLSELGGLPETMLGAPELLRRMLPTLRADLELSEMSALDKRPRLAMPIHSFAGSDDRLATPARVLAWRLETTGEYLLHVLPGGHFFTWTHADRVVGRIVQAMHPPRCPDLSASALRPPWITGADHSDASLPGLPSTRFGGGGGVRS